MLKRHADHDGATGDHGGDATVEIFKRAGARLVPLAGAPVGFGIDYAYARAVGNRAIAYYRQGT
jgi:hypothetical protein